MTVGNPAVNIAIFAAFVVATLVIVLRASRNNRTAADFYDGGRAFSGPQNGIAISGDYLSAASFLGIAGAIALNGYDGFLYSIGFLVAWLVALLLVAELLRNTGRFTMADVLSFRLRQRPVRTAAATSTLVVSFFYLLAQMAGAGGLVALLLGVSGRAQQGLVIAVVGAVMIAYVLIGGMKGTTWVQIIKATLLVLGAATMTVWVLAEYRFNLSSLLGAAVERAGRRCWSRAGSTARPGRRSWISCLSPWPWYSAPPACRTSSCASTPCRRPGRPGGPSSGPSGSSASSTCSRWCSATVRQPWSAPSGFLRRRAGRTPRRRCWPTSSAGRCCSASSRPSRSRQSWPSSPG